MNVPLYAVINQHMDPVKYRTWMRPAIIGTSFPAPDIDIDQWIARR
jgi:hypothetical protein